MYEFLLISLIIMIIIGLWIKKKYHIVIPFFGYRHVNETQKLVESILIILFIISGFWAIFFPPINLNVYGLLFAYYAIFYGFRAYMEYKHDQTEKNYLFHGFWSIASLIVFIGSIVFW